MRAERDELAPVGNIILAHTLFTVDREKSAFFLASLLLSVTPEMV